MLLVRPYPVERIADARLAIQTYASTGDVSALQALYRLAASALHNVDPDDLDSWRSEHPKVAELDKAAARAAGDVAEAWEGVVGVGSTILHPLRFRAFAWLAAEVRYELGEDGPLRRRFDAFFNGHELHGLSAEDSALFVLLPALIGLGAEFPDELKAPCPMLSTRMSELLGLPEGDWDGIDPLDGLAVTAEQCQSAYAGLTGPWRDVVGRSLQTGLLVRKG